MRNKIWIYFYIFILLSYCHYDPYPPSVEELNTKDKVLRIYLTGFTPRRKVVIQYSDAAGTYTVQDALYISDAGSFHASIYLDSSSSVYDIVLKVDQSGDGTIGAGDKNLSLNAQTISETEMKLEKAIGDFSDL